MIYRLLHRPIAVTMVLVAVVALGFLAMERIPVSLMPDIDIPRITVRLSLPGSSAREVERQIVTPMRRQLAQVTGLKDIESSARLDGGTITLSFSPGSDMSLLFIEVNEKIDRAMNSMPKDMERPKVMKMGALDIPAFYVDITSAKDDGATHEMSRLARNVISKRLEQLPEVAMADMSGTVATQITVTPDRAKMDALGLTDNDVENAIADNNIVLEALSVRDGIYRYSIHFDSQILSAADIENIYLRHEGRLIQLKEICSVEEETASRYGMVRSNGKEAVTLAVVKQNDARMADLQADMDSLLVNLRADYPDLDFRITRDQTRLLSYSIDNLGWNLALGVLMSCLVLFLFMGGWKMPLLVAMSVPLSLVVTLLCFYVAGISINIVSLSGLILGVGMIVDNAIIVIDNMRQRERLCPRGCADHGVAAAVGEVFMPMLSSVLTTCSVFVPLIFLSGTAGALFRDQALAVTTALFASLLVATLVVPVYYYAMLGREKHTSLCGVEQAKKNRVERINDWMMRVYERVLAWCFRRWWWVVVATGGCLVFVVVVFPYIRKERIPQISHDDTLLFVDWNAGITAEENDRRVCEMIKAVGNGLEAYTSMSGIQDFMLPHTKDITGSEVVCYLKAHSEKSLDSVKQALGSYVSRHYPEAKVEFSVAASVFDLIFSTDMPDLEVRLSSRDGGRPSVNEMRAVTDTLRREFPNLGIQPLSTEADVRFMADPERLAYYKITYRQIYNELTRLLSMGRIYDISSGGESVPVVVAALGASNEGLGDESARLLMHTIRNKDGVEVPLLHLLTPTRGEDYKRLSASGEGEYAPIKAERATDSEVAEVVERVKAIEAASEKTMPHALKATFEGNYFASREMIAELAVVLVVAVLLLYFILAAQFESLVQPCVILAEVVIDVCVVMVVLFVVDESLNLMSMIGLVVMSGIIINDSILKVDTINRLRRSGTPIMRAIVTAGHKRLKPIVMTSLTTILAIAPLLRRGDMGSDLQFPLSLALIAGMVAGTFVSLFFVPLMYYVIYRKKA
ncbi:MAG: efflux RND transporter permease subunit [Prevotellaceae bacterium]|nr:efflux RND transporter permease subunit [Prevotellaceae bacterium]